MFIKLKVTPESKKEEVVKVSEDSYSISVREKALRNEANKRVMQIVRNLFPEKRLIKMIAGHKSEHKIVEIED